jgi:hypothetical protein
MSGTIFFAQLAQLGLLVLLHRFSLDHGAMLGRTDIVRIRVDHRSAETAVKDLDQVHCESRSDFVQFAHVFIQDLVVTEPNAIVRVRELKHVIVERLTFRVVIGRSEYLRLNRIKVKL